MKILLILLFGYSLSVASVAQGASTLDDDAGYVHCDSFINYFSMALPTWRDGGEVPISRAVDRLDEWITNDPDWDNPSQGALDAWRRAFASTPQDIKDWNTAVESIYNSKITGKQFQRALKKYCTPHTKHVFRASDLNDLLSKSQISKQGNSTVPPPISSSPPTSSQRQCIQLGAVYQATAQVRNQGETPNEAFSYIGSLYPVKRHITKPKSNAKDRLVVLPAKLSVENGTLKSNIDGVLFEKLKQKYDVIAGVGVEAKLREITLSMPNNNGVSDKTLLLQTLARSFHSDLVVEAEISNMANGNSGYHLNWDIINISNNKVVAGSGQSCPDCNADQVVEMLTRMVGAYSQDDHQIEIEPDNLQLSEKRVKQIINQVYFDPAFRFAGGTALQMQIYQICMGTHKPIEPLK
jgi:hypothetical protein